MVYYTYEQSKEYLKYFNIKSSYQFYRLLKQGSFNNLVNKRPYEYYSVNKRNEWVSWEDFLSFSREDVNKSKYLEFKKSREYISSLGIKSQEEWIKYFKLNRLSELNIPSNPNIIYKNKGWVSLSDWLGLNSYKNIKKIEYLNYYECKEYIKSNFPEIKNKVIWTKLDKTRLPLFIPKRPDYIYKKVGDWINWESFLDSDISPRSKSSMFLDFENARVFIINLKFKDQYEFSSYIETNNINFIPKRPDYIYKKTGWIGYLDFLGCESNKSSIGERLIKTYLDENNIKYEREKKFDDCKNIKELPFDFYLPEYNLCIEYDGELHYKSSIQFGGEKRLNRVKEHDEIKNKWCKDNNIKLLRIHYLKKSRISKILKENLK